MKGDELPVVGGKHECTFGEAEVEGMQASDIRLDREARCLGSLFLRALCER